MAMSKAELGEVRSLRAMVDDLTKRLSKIENEAAETARQTAAMWMDYAPREIEHDIGADHDAHKKAFPRKTLTLGKSVG